VLQAKGLNIKGKHGTNDAFVTIALGKEKFQTSVKEKSSDPVEWNEQCELSIPSHGNTAEVSFTVLHRNFLGVDEFLGQISLPLKDFDVYERPKSSWHSLKCKPGKIKTEYRGELNVKIGFTVKANNVGGGSVADLRKKTKGSISSLNKVGGSISGSLMSIGSKEKKNIKKFAKSMSHKVEKAKQSVSTLKSNKDKGGLEALPETGQWNNGDKPRLESVQGVNNEDPGVNSDDEDDVPHIESFSRQGSNQSLGANKLELVSGNINSFSEKHQRPQVESNQKSMTATRAKSDTSTEGPPSQKAMPRSVSYSVPRREWSTTQAGNVSSTHNEPRRIQQESQSGLPSYDEAVEQGSYEKERTPIKKKIIPVHSDFDSSPSPENPSSPISSPPIYPKNRFRMSQSTINLARQEGGEMERKKKSLGLKLKSSYSFRDREDLNSEMSQNSVELMNSQHTRTHSDGGNGPPSGPRIVPGRESTPASDLPHEVLTQYNGKTREDLIEMLVTLQNTVDLQSRKVVDLEDYIDNLLMRVLEVAPILLMKDSPMVNKNHI